MFLAVQLFGNLYEEVVTNAANIADPEVGGLVDELAPGSPVYYLPWAPLGVVLVAVLAARLPRLGAPPWVVRRVRGALAALGVAVAVKVVLVTTVNPRFRDPDATVESGLGTADAPRPVHRPNGTTRLPSDSVSSCAVSTTGSAGTRS